MNHKDACKVTMMLLSQLGCRHVVQRDVGLFFDRRGNPRSIGIPGESDIQAVAPGGRAVFVEVKTGQAVRTEQQKRFARAVAQIGALYILAVYNERIDGKQTIRSAFATHGIASIDQGANDAVSA